MQRKPEELYRLFLNEFFMCNKKCDNVFSSSVHDLLNKFDNYFKFLLNFFVGNPHSGPFLSKVTRTLSGNTTINHASFTFIHYD